MRVDQVEFDEAARIIADWAAESGPAEVAADGVEPREASAEDRADAAPRRPGRYVCAANVHMTMEAYDDPDFQAVVNDADLVVADGVPMVWGLKALGARQERRVRVSPDLLYVLFDACQERGVRLGLYGGSPETLRVFCDWLAREYPRLQVACAIDPPFRPPTPEEDARYAQLIRESGAQLLLVGIGCPKQEKWMAAHTALPCTMFGVGAAFDLLGGRTKNAPAWMRDRGLEWLYRLALEPRRLWRRHLFNDPRFLVLLARQVLRERRRARRDA
jgi:N-acetylglucosaminyldiphosphoundecaprenol N-acetyl-beta-D-mannosaminyltransferase